MAAPNDEQVEIPAEENLVETPEEETSVPESSTEEQTDLEGEPETSGAPEKAEKPSEEEGLTEEEKKKLSMKAQKRFAELSKKAKQADVLEKEIKTLRETQEKEFTTGIKPEVGATSPLSQGVGRLPWEGSLEQGQPVEISPDDYKRDVLTTADWLVQARIGQAEKASEVKSDLVDIQKKYDILNPGSGKYDKDLSRRLAGLFKAQFQANPNVRLSSFVDAIMEVRQKGKEEGTAETSATLAEQKAEEALTPGEVESEQVEKPFSAMSLDEQEKYLKDHGLWE